MARERPDRRPVVLPEAWTMAEQVLPQVRSTSHHLGAAHHEGDVVEKVDDKEEGHGDQGSASLYQRKLQLLQIEGAQVELARKELVPVFHPGLNPDRDGGQAHR